MRRFITLLLILIIFAQPSIVFGQDTLLINQLQIDIWPEYDRPDVLVIYRIIVSSSNPLPIQMEMRIPLEANKPFNLAGKDINGMLYNLDYTTRMVGEWIVVSFTTPSPEIQLEYYDPRLKINGTLRSFEYRWPGDYEVSQAQIRIQKPINASWMQIKPDLGDGVKGLNELTYFSSVIGSVPRNTPFTIQFEYEKPDQVLSSIQEPVFPSHPVGQQTLGRTSLAEAIPWVIGGLGVLMIIGGGIWYWHTGRVSQKNRNRQKEPRFKPPERNSDLVRKDTVYCHKCGKRALAGDLFCRICGTRLQLD